MGRGTGLETAGIIQSSSYREAGKSLFGVDSRRIGEEVTETVSIDGFC